MDGRHVFAVFAVFTTARFGEQHIAVKPNAAVINFQHVAVIGTAIRDRIAGVGRRRRFLLRLHVVERNVFSGLQESVHIDSNIRRVFNNHHTRLVLADSDDVLGIDFKPAESIGQDCKRPDGFRNFVDERVKALGKRSSLLDVDERTHNG